MQAKGYEVRIYTPNLDLSIVMQDGSDIAILSTVFTAIENKVLKSIETPSMERPPIPDPFKV